MATKVKRKKEMSLKKAISVLRTHGLFVDAGRLKKLSTKNIKQTLYIEEGHTRYYVCCERFFVYTSIGADNIHHASNKATKLFGPHWSHLTPNAGAIHEFSYVKPTDFKLFLTN